MDKIDTGIFIDTVEVIELINTKLNFSYFLCKDNKIRKCLSIDHAYNKSRPLFLVSFPEMEK